MIMAVIYYFVLKQKNIPMDRVSVDTINGLVETNDVIELEALYYLIIKSFWGLNQDIIMFYFTLHYKIGDVMCFY